MVGRDDRTEKVRALTPEARWKIWGGRVLAILAATTLLGCAGIVAIFTYLAQDLPTIESLRSYAPKEATVLYGSGGEVVARFTTERRTVVPYKRVPKVMVDAVVAAEDAAFFSHAGLDYLGIVRCVVKSALAGRTVCGASTITQQMVRTFLLTKKKKMTRKIREAILTKRVEESLSKEEILWLYLNQIYFGHRAYGIQAASRVYFGKNVERLTLAEAALLAGLPQQPHRIDPYRNPEGAKRRRQYVLRMMLKTEKIDKAAFEQASKAPIELIGGGHETDLDSNNHYAAHVRKLLGKGAIDSGLSVYTGMDPNLQRSAEAALRSGLEALDKRQGWRGPLMRLDLDQMKALLPRLQAKVDAVRAEGDDTDAAPMIFDLASVSVGDDAEWFDIDAIVGQARTRRLALNSRVAGIVTVIDDIKQRAVVDVGGAKIHLPTRSGLQWARKFSLAGATRRPKRPSDVLSAGDIVLVQATKKSDTFYVGTLEQAPLVQGAFVAIDPQSREVRALVGGYGLGAGRYNRATQARRQAGSTFKPLVYAAALETRAFTTISLCQDAPRVYRDPWTRKSWKPKNYGGTFDGEITLRRALSLSKNLCSVELIDRLGRQPGESDGAERGVEMVINLARRLGVRSPLPKSLTLALGSGDVTVLEMVNAYATLAAGGRHRAPRLITKRSDERVTPPEELLVLDPAVAYLVTDLMRSVVEEGTAQRVKVLNRPVAGKTGTTNEARDAWFIGYTPEIVAGVWVGFDDNARLGPRETGGRAAIPIWLEFMKAATADRAPSDFVAPESVVFAFVDPQKGALASPTAEGARAEPFLEGTLPTDITTERAKLPQSFGLDDFEYEQ